MSVAALDHALSVKSNARRAEEKPTDHVCCDEGGSLTDMSGLSLFLPE